MASSLLSHLQELSLLRFTPEERSSRRLTLKDYLSCGLPPKSIPTAVYPRRLLLLTVGVLNVDSALHSLTLCD